MISEIQLKRYCCEDVSKIENYEQAVNDHTQTWVCHHRLEIQGPFTNSKELLIKCGIYYGVPASQLIFLTHAEHTSLHSLSRAKSGWYMTEERRRKMSEVNRGRIASEETRRKQSLAKMGHTPWNKGKHWSEESRRKMSDAHKGLPVSEDARRNMLLAQRRRRERERALTNQDI